MPPFHAGDVNVTRCGKNGENDRFVDVVVAVVVVVVVVVLYYSKFGFAGGFKTGIKRRW